MAQKRYSDAVDGEMEGHGGEMAVPQFKKGTLQVTGTFADTQQSNDSPNVKTGQPFGRKSE